MPNAVINLYGDTYINTRNMDVNYCNADKLKYGNDNNGISKAILLFHLDFNFTYKVIKSVTLKFRVAAKNVYAGGNIRDSSVFMGIVYVYDGLQKDYISEITQRNSSEYLTGIKSSTKIERLSVNNGDYASINIGVGNYDWNNGWITAVIDGWSDANGDYYGEIYSNDANLIVEYEPRIPNVTLEELEVNTINNANSFTVNWNYACEAELPQKSYEIGWSSDGGINWHTVVVNSAETWHEFAVNTFPGGNIKLRLRVTNVDEQVSGYATTEVYVIDNVPMITLTYPLEVSVNQASLITFTWDYSEVVEVGQKTYEIGWSSDGGTNWRTVIVNSNEHYHEYPADTFPGGVIRWRIRSTNNYNKISEYAYGVFTSILNVPVVTVSYPNEVNLNNSSRSIFTWDYTEEVLVGQKSYEIGWSSDGGTNWNTVTVTADRHYHEYPANTFPVGEIRWRIKTTNNYNKTSVYSYGKFTAIGQTAAPVIVSVSQDAIPTVTWTSQYQDCYEIRIREGSRIIYESGLMMGSDVKSYRCNVMIPDGVYSVEIRMINTYGYYTEWNTYSYVLATVKPQAAQVLEVSKQKDFSVKISGIVPRGLKAYVIRKDAVTNEEVIIGIYSEEFYDYTAPLNREYLYTIRTYDATRLGGYTDGELKGQRVESGGGIILHDAANMKNCIVACLSEENLLEIGRTDTYTKTFYKVIGRKYPVKEQMDWMESQREVSIWLSDEDYERIQNINISSGNVYYRAEKEAFLCDMEIQLTGRYIGGGMFLKISLNRLDEDLEVKLL